MQSQATKDRYSKPRARGKTGMGGKRTGDFGYSSMDAYHTFRTHIFLNPSNLPQEYEDEVTSSLTSKRPSITLMKWATGGAKRKPSGGKADFPPQNQNDTPSRQVSTCIVSAGMLVFTTKEVSSMNILFCFLIETLVSLYVLFNLFSHISINIQLCYKYCFNILLA